MRIFVLMAVMVMLADSLPAQDYVAQGKNRLNFAKTYIEISGQYLPSFKSLRTQDGITLTNPASLTPQLNFGGIHFWGHADFYFSIPLQQIKFKQDDVGDFTLRESVVTGARVMPWAYRDKQFTPYIGARWSLVAFQQKWDDQTSTPVLSKSKVTIDGGILFGAGDWMFRAGATYYPASKWNYPTLSGYQQVRTPVVGFNIGLIYSMETTRSRKDERLNASLMNYPNLSAPAAGDELTQKGDWFVGIGPSSSFMLSEATYNREYFPFLNKKPVSNTFLDFSIGYQFNRAGIVTAVSFRNPRFKNEGYGVSQSVEKRSVLVEAFKYLIDYSGFTPYVGINVGVDKIKYRDVTSSAQYGYKTTKVTPGLTVGWDILPGKTSQPVVLRTNLRWFPFASMEIKGKGFSLKQLEYNVIQLVIYPERFKRMKTIGH